MKNEKLFFLSYRYVSYTYKPWPWCKEENVYSNYFMLVYAETLEEAEKKLRDKFKDINIVKIKNHTIE